MLRLVGAALACMALAAAALAPAPARAAAQVALAPDPAWVELLPVRGEAESTPAEDGTRYLLVDDQVSLLGAEPAWHRRLVERVVHESGLATAARLSIDFQPLYQRVELHAIEIVRDDRRLDYRGRADVQVLRRESDMESGILDGRLTVQVTVPDVRVGDRLDYRFSVIGFNPIFGDDYHDAYAAAYGVPVGERRVRFVHPPGMELKHQVDRPGFARREGGGPGFRSLELRASDVPGVLEDPDTPQWHDAAGRLRFTTSAGWPSVARWAAPLYPRRLTDRALARDLVQRLRLDPADPLGSMERAIAFVQGEVRYTAIDMGSNSHAPSPPETTLERRFGDCKDKSALLVALLAEAGIEAEPVLVNTVARAAIRDRLPSPFAFDHVVVRARTAGGDVWIDATRGRERAPLAAREPLPFRLGLPVYGGGELVEIPAPPPALPDIEVTQRIRLGLDGNRARALFGVVTDYRRGEAEGRRVQYEVNSPRDIGERYLSYMRGFYDGIESTALPAVAGPPAEGALRVVEGYRLDWEAPRGERGFGIVLFQLGDWLPRLDGGTRTTPRVVAGPDYATQTIRVDSPRGWSIQPERDRIANPWFSFERRVHLEDGELVVTGSWRRHADEVPAAEWPRFRDDVRAARELLTYGIDMGAPPVAIAGRLADWRWPAVAALGLGLLLALAWWRRARDPLSGMLFAPRRTTAKLLAGDRNWWAVGLLVLAVALVSGFTSAPRAEGGGWGATLAAAFGSAASLAVFALLLKGCLRLLSVRAGFTPLLLACAWACVPYLLLMLAAITAVGWRPGLFESGGAVQPGGYAGVLACILFVMAGTCWNLVAGINAGAVAAGTGRARMVGAYAIALLFLAGFATVAAIVYVIVLVSSGGTL